MNFRFIFACRNKPKKRGEGKVQVGNEHQMLNLKDVNIQHAHTTTIQ